jgi:uncharacterized SAM-binding protein YcdF (DUF218 family)
MPLSLEHTIDLMITPLMVSWLMMVISLLAQFRKRSRMALVSNVIAVLVLWFAGTGIVSSVAARVLELQYPGSQEMPHADAIVVLAGVTGKAYPPQPVVHLGPGSDRLVYATELYKKGDAPLVAFSGDRNESAEMAEVMEMMGVPRESMLEEDTHLQNTFGAALNMKQALLSHNVHTVLLVTSAIRMPRAMAVFERLGFRAIPAPTDFITRISSGSPDIVELAGEVLPNMGNLSVSTAALHELWGLLGYRLAGWI